MNLHGFDPATNEFLLALAISIRFLSSLARLVSVIIQNDERALLLREVEHANERLATRETAERARVAQWRYVFHEVCLCFIA